MNQIVVGSKIIGSRFSVDVIPLHFASSIRDLSKLRIGKFAKALSVALRVIKSLLTTKYDLVYFTLSPVGSAFYRDLLFVSIIKLFRVKILYHLHGKGIRRAAESSSIKKQLYKFAFRDTSVIVLAHSLGTDIKDVYSGTCYVVNNGIAPMIFSPQINTIDKSDVVEILYLSNLVRSKGILLFLDSLCILRENNVFFRATIVGNDGDINKEDLYRLIKQFKLEDAVYVIGPKYGSDKYELLNTSDIFCFPTFKDAFPLVLLEAMQCGKPIVSTFEGAIPEIVDNGKTGLLVHQQNTEELADALQKLISDEKLRRKMGENGRKKFELLYTLECFEKNICEVFEFVANQKGT